MGWYHDEPVLLIRASNGNRALGWDRNASCELVIGHEAFVNHDRRHAFGNGDHALHGFAIG
jgi:hypothetical protein